MRFYDGILGKPKHDELGRWVCFVRCFRIRFLVGNTYRLNTFRNVALETDPEKIVLAKKRNTYT